MAVTYKCLAGVIGLIACAASHALAPISSAEGGSLQQPPAALSEPSNPTAPGTSDNNSILQAALNSTDPIAVLRNATQGPLGGPVLYCNGEEYGEDLPLASCIEAIEMIPDTDQKLSFGPRPLRRFHFGTPYRILSNDGLCAIDFESNSNNYIDVVRAHDLADAGRRLLAECYAENKQGGIVRRLGDREHINMILHTYSPNVRCSAPGSAFSPTFPDCNTITDSQIPLDKATRAFGRAGEPQVGEVLPITVVDACAWPLPLC
ncbi:MAG: hypothetical protein Q9216_002032 [Gyalolechia sp. 2 TL-2023]